MVGTISNQKRAQLYSELNSHGLQLGNDGFVERKLDAKRHPRNWNVSRKAFNAGLVCFFEFWMTLISSSGVSRRTSHRKHTLSTNIRDIRPTYTVHRRHCSLLYLQRRHSSCTIGRTVCVGRLLTGFASAIPGTVAYGSFGRFVRQRDTHLVSLCITLVGNIGLVLGAIYSAYVTTYAGWRWVFYISAIVSGIGIIPSRFLQESRTAYLLELEVKLIQERVSDKSLRVPERQSYTLRSFADHCLFRPVELLITKPIITCCAVLMTVTYSLIIYGLTEGLTVVYTEFGFAESTTSSLSFLPILLGLLLNVVPRLYDQKLFTRYRRNNIPVRPETKICSLLTSCPALAAGLWLFAWTIPPRVPHVHWIVSMMGLVLVGYADNDLAHIFFGYLTDSYGPYAASACAALNLSRTLVAAVYPLFTYRMYTSLGGNVATSVFAAIATIFSITPVVLIRYGRKLRARSRFARGVGDDDEREEETGLRERETKAEAGQRDSSASTGIIFGP